MNNDQKPHCIVIYCLILLLSFMVNCVDGNYIASISLPDIVGSFSWTVLEDGFVDMMIEISENVGWVGFGVQNEGRMLGASVVIGMDALLNQEVYPNVDTHYHIGDTYRENSIVPCINNSSKLRNYSFGVENTNLTLKVSVNSFCFQALNLTGTDRVIYAYGKENRFSEHEDQGSFVVSWQQGHATSSPTNLPTNVPTNSPTSISSSPTSISSSPTGVSNSPTSISNSPTSISNSPTSISNSPTSISNSPTSISNSPTSISNTFSPSTRNEQPSLSPTFDNTFPTLSPSPRPTTLDVLQTFCLFFPNSSGLKNQLDKEDVVDAIQAGFGSDFKNTTIHNLTVIEHHLQVNFQLFGPEIVSSTQFDLDKITLSLSKQYPTMETPEIFDTCPTLNDPVDPVDTNSRFVLGISLTVLILVLIVIGMCILCNSYEKRVKTHHHRGDKQKKQDEQKDDEGTTITKT